MSSELRTRIEQIFKPQNFYTKKTGGNKKTFRKYKNINSRKNRLSEKNKNRKKK
jgi:hypothetical protein